MEQKTEETASGFDMTDVGLYDPLTYSSETEENTDASETGDQTEDDSPNKGSESPDGKEKPNKGQEEELKLGQEDVDKLRAVLDTAGFKTIDAFLENYAEQRRVIPELKHTLNSYDSKFADLEAKIETSKAPPKPPEKEYTDDELTTMIADKPKEFMAFMQGQLLKSLNESGLFKDISTQIGELKRETSFNRFDRMLDNIRRDNPDFGEYEPEIDKMLQSMGSSLKDIKSEPLVLTLYENLKYKRDMSALSETIKKLKNGEQIVDEQARKASKIGKSAGKGGGDPLEEKGPKDKQKETLKTPVGEIAREDLDLVYDPTGAYIASLKTVSK
ncbi:MAG: hypothetical protein ACREOP_01525 [Thermodesulfobacteriota bacterium]